MGNDFMNQLVRSDCVKFMRTLPDECIPLCVTSPPYDNIRTYGGHRFDFEAVASELYRIMVPGGVVAWIVGEQIVKGSESCSSCKQKLYFREIGFRIHHTMIFDPSFRRMSSNRYGAALQYIVLLSKGKPKHVNRIRDRKTKWPVRARVFNQRKKGGTIERQRRSMLKAWGVRGNVWTYNVGKYHTTRDAYAFKHPALMHELLATDLIISFSKPGELVFDPMCGAGTVPKMALLNNRSYLGCEINSPYLKLAQRRIRDAKLEHVRHLDKLLGVA